MNKTKRNLLLADDDEDDRFFFKEALEDLPIATTLTTVNDGVQLMDLLSKVETIPDILFLDLNMPRKSGFECLSEIKSIDKLAHFPVIIFSTSLDTEVVNLLYQKGAHYYMRKPGEYAKLKLVILEALTVTAQNNSMQPPRDKFILQP